MKSWTRIPLESDQLPSWIWDRRRYRHVSGIELTVSLNNCSEETGVTGD